MLITGYMTWQRKIYKFIKEKLWASFTYYSQFEQKCLKLVAGHEPETA